jgi:periplasmic protein TonB
MFDHLVESSSHKEDIARKGSFIGVTLAIYAVLIVGFVVAGILWYDAHLSELELELTTLVAPVPVPQQQKAPEQKQEAKPQQKVDQNVDVRKELIADVAESRLPPKEISAKASDVPPVRRGVTTMVGSDNSNASAPMPAGPGSGNVVSAPASVAIADEPPPPAPTPTPRTAPISGGVLNGKAISLPKPQYPPIARAAHASGTVVVQVLIDENGNVVSAKAVSGHPLLQAVAVAAARQARFSPTKLSGQPVKVTGVIQYNFVAQ